MKNIESIRPHPAWVCGLALAQKNRQLAYRRTLFREFLTPLNIEHKSDYFIQLGDAGTI